MVSITKKLQHTVRNKIKKNRDNWLKNKKDIQSLKMSKKMGKKLKNFSLNMHKGAEILKKPQNLSK